MFQNKKILAIIPARGGSKGVPRKNIRLAGGKPLISWIIEAAQKSVYIDRLILSSDDDEIIQVAQKCGCEVPFIRPYELAQDNSSISDVVLHALNQIPGYDYVMVLQPTSPLTIEDDIDGCIELCISSGYKSLVSVTEPNKSPYWMFKMGPSNQLEPILGQKYLQKRRQDLPSAYIPTGAVYIAESIWFLHNKSFYSEMTSGYIIPSRRSLDIDTEDDLKLFTSKLRHQKKLNYD